MVCICYKTNVVDENRSWLAKFKIPKALALVADKYNIIVAIFSRKSSSRNKLQVPRKVADKREVAGK
jgi:hypothetical protein